MNIDNILQLLNHIKAQQFVLLGFHVKGDEAVVLYHKANSTELVCHRVFLAVDPTSFHYGDYGEQAIESFVARSGRKLEDNEALEFLVTHFKLSVMPEQELGAHFKNHMHEYEVIELHNVIKYWNLNKKD